ncbi:UDP-N-acetylmuramoyl-L-alanine--D-glutamate ligase [Abyssisolibacter fermentans]|uniref:UDP-N-acetylmuramoyl-L-alanine--D-glutamate ligase n=1 Tax=Abyssisolibacter fermentans TaxID=1766203 RepID=UPI0023DDD96F|nr:UDP-N-acetylmuramoyl-L-alanine--D-glutamate ligase [Abyssisolibacter fermentans]
MKNKTVLVLGLGITGVSSAKALSSLKAKVVVCDNKTKDQLTKYIDELKDYEICYKLGGMDIELEDIDLIVKSPGVPLDVEVLKKAYEKGIEVVTDIELAYRLCNNKFIAISGTNGKTTTTALLGKILKNNNMNVHVTGNIGVGILWEIVNSNDDDIFVIEASSFQLENTKSFKPKVSVLTNITPDHINWHKSFDNYVKAKKKIYKNQDSDDYTVLNYNDAILNKAKEEIKSNIIFFSSTEKLDEGVYIDGEYIVINMNGNYQRVMKYKDIRMIGKHNLENSLAAICVAWAIGVDFEIIAETLREFKGIEHRFEEVACINGAKYYNDSKGTNPDSSISALEALNKPIILIAGGYDKGSDFEAFIKAFDGKVEALILLGETAKQIQNTAINLGFDNIYKVRDMCEAVNTAYTLSREGSNVLLSPACASWDMYDNFEIRGTHFKKCVEDLRRLEDGQKEG